MTIAIMIVGLLLGTVGTFEFGANPPNSWFEFLVQLTPILIGLGLVAMGLLL